MGAHSLYGPGFLFHALSQNPVWAGCLLAPCDLAIGSTFIFTSTLLFAYTLFKKRCEQDVLLQNHVFCPAGSHMMPHQQGVRKRVEEQAPSSLLEGVRASVQ